MKSKFVISIVTIALLEVLIYVYSNQISGDETILWQLSARYSARTSFVLISSILLWTGWKGLRHIYSIENNRKNFLLLIALLTINHLIHFGFLYMNFQANGMELFSAPSSAGAVGYLALVGLPIYLWNRRELTGGLYKIIYAVLFTLIGIFFVTYFGRLSQEMPIRSPMVLYQINMGIIVLLFGLNVFRIIKKG